MPKTSAVIAGKVTGESLDHAPKGFGCAHCGGTKRLLVLYRTDVDGQPVEQFRLCAESLALGLETATGYGFVGQLAHMTGFSKQAAALAKESWKSRRAKQNAAEVASKQATRRTRGVK